MKVIVKSDSQFSGLFCKVCAIAVNNHGSSCGASPDGGCVQVVNRFIPLIPNGTESDITSSHGTTEAPVRRFKLSVLH
jgi:hypothetical protein